jgi:hypothetical protein
MLSNKQERIIHFFHLDIIHNMHVKQYMFKAAPYVSKKKSVRTWMDSMIFRHFSYRYFLNILVLTQKR